MARRLVAAAGMQSGEPVVEIGPGTGQLTRALLEMGGPVLAVEIDPDLADGLSDRVGGNPRLTVLRADATEVDWAHLLDRHLGVGQRARAVGNLPYEAATAILTSLLGAADHLLGLAVVVQREVADRITAEPGSRTYGYLSVLCQDVATTRRLLLLRPGAFQPPPAVQSALVGLEPRARPRRGDLDEGRFRAFVGGLFLSRRKTILNNLRARAGLDRDAAEAALARAGIDAGLRPEDLTVEAFATLYGALPSPEDGHRL